MISVRKLWAIAVVTILMFTTVLPAAIPVNAADNMPTIAGIKDVNANGMGWTDLVVNISLHASSNPPGLGIREVHYSIDGGTEIVVPSPLSDVQFTLDDDNKHEINFYAIDNAGVSSELVTWIPRTIEIISPENSRAYPVPANPDDFPPFIYRITDYSTEPPTIDTINTNEHAPCDPGINFVAYHEKDSAGNISNYTAWYAVIDMVPEVLINVPANKGIYKLGILPQELEGSLPGKYVEDADYTVSYINVPLDVEVENYSTELGTHTVTITATDTNSNSSGSASSTYLISKNPRKEIDKASPLITIKSPAARTYYTYEDFVVHIGVQSRCSGFATFQAFIDGTEVQNLQNIDIRQLGVGRHEFTVIATDKDYITSGDGAYLVSTKTIKFNVVYAPLPAAIKVMPDTINLKSIGGTKSVTAIVNLLYKDKQNQIDPSTVTMDVNGTLIPALVPAKLDKCNISTLKFDRQAVINALSGINKFPSKVTVIVHGFLTDGTEFSGKDTIKVIDHEYKDNDHNYDKPGCKDIYHSWNKNKDNDKDDKKDNDNKSTLISKNDNWPKLPSMSDNTNSPVPGSRTNRGTSTSSNAGSLLSGWTNFKR